jgi:hypothetical protein
MNSVINDAKTESEVQEVEKVECPCCEITKLASATVVRIGYSSGGYINDRGYALGYPKPADDAGAGEWVCSFCKLLFPSIKPRVPSLSNIELLGAWYDFQDDVIQWCLTAGIELKEQRYKAQALEQEAFRLWVCGSLSDGVSDGQNGYLSHMWYVLALERLLSTIEMAHAVAEIHQHTLDVSTIKAAVEDPRVAPVWYSWLGGHSYYGKEQNYFPGEHKRLTRWYKMGLNYAKSCTEWSNGDD